MTEALPVFLLSIYFDASAVGLYALSRAALAAPALILGGAVGGFLS